ncbi:MAG: hypothetical protein ACI4OI_03570 [Gemmiger sp.]
MGGKASAASKNAWNARNYDRINLIVKKGQKQVIQQHAEKTGESVNGFINRAIEEAMQRDQQQLPNGGQSAAEE